MSTNPIQMNPSFTITSNTGGSIVINDIYVTVPAGPQGITLSELQAETSSDLWTLQQQGYLNVSQVGVSSYSLTDLSVSDKATVNDLIVSGTLTAGITITSPLPSGTNNIGMVTIGGSTISVPMNIQTITRPQVFVTTAPLTSSGSYTLPAASGIDGTNYRRLTGRVFADQAGTLYLEHSDDGNTWDSKSGIAVAANTLAVFDEEIYARYIRVVYTNGATAQTVFRCSAYLSPL